MKIDVDAPPKDMAANLAWRTELNAQSIGDQKMQLYIAERCRTDILYFLNGFAWLHEPRPRFSADGKLLPKVFPFLTWPHQDKSFVEVRKHLGIEDIAVEKCRGEGWTWFEVYASLQDWLFETMVQVGLVSSTEKKSDSGNMGSIMGKIDFALTTLPDWMKGPRGKDRNEGAWYRNFGEHLLVNRVRGNQIVAFAASPDTGRGDRFTWFGLDEHASEEWKKENKDEKVLEAIAGATDSILYISTPCGTHGAFHRIVKNESNVKKIYIDWRDNPTKNQGLYRMVSGVPVAVDPVNNPLPENYNPPSKAVVDMFSRLRKNGFNLDAGPSPDRNTRSPWLDRQCDRGSATPQTIAQEHERDYGGSMAQFFGPSFNEKVDASIRPPDIVGELKVMDDGTYSFDRIDNGRFLLWTTLDEQGDPPKRPYVLGADIASGEGGLYCSNSAIFMVDLVTGEQVLEFVTSTIKPTDLADVAIALCQWFHGAYLAWEHMGPGASFGKYVIQDRNYLYSYQRKAMDKASRLVSKAYGYINKGGARETLFADLEKFVRTEDLVIRSKFAAAEFGQYIRDEKGIHHASAKATDASHGDRVIALGICVQAMKDRPVAKPESGQSWDGGPPPFNTPAYREWLHEQNEMESAETFDNRSTADLRERHGQLAGVF